MTMALARGRRLRGSYRGATRLGFADIIIIAIVMAILLFASWKQFPAYHRPFTPLPRSLTTALSAPASIRTPAPRAASQR
ncbi:MAG: hypothetical protein ACREPW_03305 [Candidatus Binataceae bacterium]